MGCVWFTYGRLELCYWWENGIMETKNKLAERKAFDDSMTNIAACACYMRRLRLFS